MQVGESSLKTLIEGQKQFQVPLFQRQYAWRDAQLGQLWEDVLDQYDLLTPDDSGKPIDPPAPHFLGSMVLAPSPQIPAQGVTPFIVIDGQQRLTTLLLALAAVRDHSAVHDDRAVERFNELYLVNKYGAGLAYYRLLPTQSDRESFFACVNGEPARLSGGIGRAYGFFRARLTQPGPDDKPLDIRLLETVLWERMQFVAITADRGDNVHRIFESLNDRGVRLTQADLLRNYVFMLLPTRAESVYENVWRPMQEMLTPAELETLVFVDLVLRGRTAIKRPDIYRAQQERLRPLENNEPAVEAEVIELARRARLFQRIVQPETEPHLDVRASLTRLDEWGATTTYPLIMHLLDLRDRGECDSADVVEALSYVESFLVRRMIVGVAPNNLNRIFSRLVPSLAPDNPIAESVRRALSGERRYWPTDHRLREAMKSQPFYFQGRQEQKMLVFKRLESSFGHGEPIDWRSSKLSIEHIMPQALTNDWRAALSASGEDPEAVHAELLHTLGNLTVTAYNGQLSNNPFSRKQEILEDSHLELNRQIAPEGKWGRSEILERADDLASMAIVIWPGPVPGLEEPNGGRDWSVLHAALAALPYGTWTTYSDLAELIGSHPVPVGQHLTLTPAVLNAHRVLNAEGRIAENFRWVDPADTRTVSEVLAEEGVTLGADGRADSSQRVRSEELAALVGEAIESQPREDDLDYGWRLRRLLRYLGFFYESPDGRLHEGIARALALEVGYDPRGVAGFYQGTASLRRDGAFRILTDSGRQYFEENRHLLD